MGADTAIHPAPISPAPVVSVGVDVRRRIGVSPRHLVCAVGGDVRRRIA